MDVEQSQTEIHAAKEKAPRAVPRGVTSFADLAAAVDTSTPAGERENAVWKLANILFGDEFEGVNIPDNVDELGPDERWTLISRLRKEMLSNFWKELVKSDAEKAVFNAGTNEEKAMHHLSAGNVTTACRDLMTGGDFKLATMLAQVSGSDAKFREQVRKQITHWSDIDSLSEINGTVRAFYEILAGNTDEVAGKEGHRENQIKGFNISQRFGFDWKRAFGLKLWYGTLHDASIEDAVLAYQLALEEDKEKVKPVPSFVHQSDEDDNREDLLWGLLQLYAAQESSDVHVRLERVFDPENVSSNPVDARLCWQLLQIFRAKGIRSSVAGDDDEDSEKENRGVATRNKSQRPASSLSLASDALTSTYASALSSALPTTTRDQQPHLLYTALFVLAHLSNDTARQSAMQNLLYQTAPLLASEDTLQFALPYSKPSTTTKKSNTTIPDQAVTLVNATTSKDGLSIPRQWLASAQALWATAVDNDPAAQARYLLEAGQLNEAHGVLMHQIGPSCIVKRNYDLLREVLGGFEGHTKHVAAWRTGGGVYFDFVHLLDMENMHEAAKVKERKDTVARLIDGLTVIGKEIGKDASDDERAAVWEMGRVVADKAISDKVSLHMGRLIMLEGGYVNSANDWAGCR